MRLRSFGLAECAEEGYPARTRLNITSSDGTLLVGAYRRGGSRLTCEMATEFKKPLFHVAFSSPPDGQHNAQRVEEFRYWLERYATHTLKVADNRESENPGIAEFTRTFLVSALRANP